MASKAEISEKIRRLQLAKSQIMQLNGHLSGISLSDVKAAGNHHWKGNVYQQEYLNWLTEVKADKKKASQGLRTINQDFEQKIKQLYEELAAAKD